VRSSAYSSTDYKFSLVLMAIAYHCLVALIVCTNYTSLLKLWCLSTRFDAYYAALLPRRGPHIASHSVCMSVRLSVRPVSGCTLFSVAPSYERTSKIEKLRFSLMGQLMGLYTFRHAQRAAYRTAISAAQILVVIVLWMDSRRT